ncbi:unannotated protein [freshwater metagenome]|uniref:Unannotated protein n=1 Tax=freshwater metagenome TaxID=449393 RepID=A0A6J6UCH1_9ZZZZ
MHVGEIAAWPKAAPIILLSGTFGSSPCSINRWFCIPFTSICTVPLVLVPLIGVGSFSEPPALRRRSSIDRRALRADLPTSSIRVFKPSSSSMTVNGMTIAQFGKEVKQFGSATSTEVSKTTREPTGVAKISAICARVFSESEFCVDNEIKCGRCRSSDGGWFTPKISKRASIYWFF